MELEQLKPIVPVAENGLEGWTSCCEAAVTYHDGVLCCKGCWQEVEHLLLTGEKGQELGTILSDAIVGRIEAEEGIRRQRELLARKEEGMAEETREITLVLAIPAEADASDIVDGIGEQSDIAVVEWHNERMTEPPPPVQVRFKHEDDMGGMPTGPVYLIDPDKHDPRKMVPFGEPVPGMAELGWMTLSQARLVAAAHGVELEED